MRSHKILFANVPADGHFNPLTELAVYLKNQGHDVRWYAGKSFEKKLSRFGIQHYPFDKAMEVNQFNIDEHFPQRAKMKEGVPKLKFDLKHFFVYRSSEYFEDIKQVHATFPFEIMICDATFTGGPLVKNKMGIPVIAIGIIPLSQTSKDLAPYGMGLSPDNSFMGRIKQSILRSVAKNLLFKESSVEYNKILGSYSTGPFSEILFDVPVLRSNLLLQSGVPGFEYKRSDLHPNVKFVGALKTYKDPSRTKSHTSWVDKLKGHKVLLVSQGTFEPDHSKLIIPTLEAFKDTDKLVLVATGYHNTEALRNSYPQSNIIIEDFMDFDAIMPLCDVYITNGGYGGTLMSVEHSLPMVCAGVNEGKNEICTRIGYFNIGVDLKTERPTPAAVKAATEKVLGNNKYKTNVSNLQKEFAGYDTMKLCEQYIHEVLN